MHFENQTRMEMASEIEKMLRLWNLAGTILCRIRRFCPSFKGEAGPTPPREGAQHTMSLQQGNIQTLTYRPLWTLLLTIAFYFSKEIILKRMELMQHKKVQTILITARWADEHKLKIKPFSLSLGLMIIDHPIISIRSWPSPDGSDSPLFL